MDGQSGRIISAKAKGYSSRHGFVFLYIKCDVCCPVILAQKVEEVLIIFPGMFMNLRHQHKMYSDNSSMLILIQTSCF